MEKFILFADQMRSIDKDFNLSFYEIHLLDRVAMAQLSGQDIFIGELIEQKDIASKATLHKSIKALVLKKCLH
ncbi:aspartokinase-like uncharacterized kinase [Polynucleobacter sphagniphilus]|uniref:hypothetical protein n=1 Tax=Polynucleobacter sphagniphilus TaxID=1743169 RepID=UPI002473DEB6|nr:hypothetical protein [Polynucleobacter sphagniphilus]MDH6242133.1 aspartokinase-like uncharacterized kinase [Polynucleobacter sphagniphilus]